MPIFANNFANYLTIPQIRQAFTGIRQQIIPTQNGNLIPKLQILARVLVGHNGWRQIEDAFVDEVCCVDHLCEFGQRLLSCGNPVSAGCAEVRAGGCMAGGFGE